MVAPISVIIPTLNVSQTIGPCLGAVAVGLNAGLIREVIIADGGSDDFITEIAEQSGAKIIQSSKGRGQQLNAGARIAKGEWLLFLHADTVLEQLWPERALAHLKSPHKAGYFKLSFDKNGLAPRLTAGWANLRSRIFGLPYGDQGLLIHRDIFAKIGGYDDIPLMEDVSIALKLKGNLVPLNAVATTSAEKYQQQGWIKRGAKNLALLTRYLLGANPETLAKRY